MEVSIRGNYILRYLEVYLKVLLEVPQGSYLKVAIWRCLKVSDGVLRYPVASEGILEGNM